MAKLRTSRASRPESNPSSPPQSPQSNDAYHPPPSSSIAASSSSSSANPYPSYPHVRAAEEHHESSKDTQIRSDRTADSLSKPFVVEEKIQVPQSMGGASQLPNRSGVVSKASVSNPIESQTIVTNASKSFVPAKGKHIDAAPSRQSRTRVGSGSAPSQSVDEESGGKKTSTRKRQISSISGQSKKEDLDDVPLNDGEFEVEEIRNMKRLRARVQYLVKWLNYPESDNTWEPAENILSRQLISRFQNNLKKPAVWEYCSVACGKTVGPRWSQHSENDSAAIEKEFKDWLATPTVDTAMLQLTSGMYEMDFNRMIQMNTEPSGKLEYLRRSVK
eukprot:TRINITY_DN4187_c0_g1_i1.p1 TRINITY_DN4187_c0_g1~~TRINITY_DN4187_c0_g1_i1.p1  ORF type:complete len:332 (+),score=66.91 TRINITY_DN4187_c0_g1_i1:90-1085(+)